jgi:hypothetical protein
MQVEVELVLLLQKEVEDLVDLAVVEMVEMVQDLFQEQELLEQQTLVVVEVVVIADLLEQLLVVMAVQV